MPSSLLLAILVTFGCAKGSSSTSDAGRPDSGADGGVADAGVPDAEVPDVDGSVDGGTVDGGIEPPARGTTVVVTGGGDVLESASYRLRVSAGAPQPMGSRTDGVYRLRLGPQTQPD